MRFGRILLRIVVVVLALVAGTLTTAVAVSQTAWFRNWLRGTIEREARQYLDGELSIERLDGNLFYGVELKGVAITAGGTPALTIQQLRLDYNLFHLVTSGISANEIRIVRPAVYTRHDANGWSISRLIKKQEQEADRRGPKYPMSVDTVAIHDGTIVIDDQAGMPGVDLPDRIEQLNADFSFNYEPVRYSLTIRKVDLHGSGPSIDLNELRGGLAIRDDTLFIDKLAMRLRESSFEVDGAIENYLEAPAIKMRARSEKVALSELAGLIPSLAGRDLQPAFNISLDGPLERLGIDAQLRSQEGSLRARVVADVQEPAYAASGNISVDHLDVAPLADPDLAPSDITAQGTIEVRADSLTDLNTMRGSVALKTAGAKAAGYVVDALDLHAKIDGRQIALTATGAAYGASMTAAGRATIPEGDKPFTYDFSGQMRAIDLRRLPRQLGAPPAATNINAGYHATGVQPVGEAAKRATAALDLALKFAPSSAPGVRVEGGSTAGLRVRGHEVSYTADAELSDLNLREVGLAFDVPALIDPRYESRLATHVVAEGAGTTLAGLRLSARGGIRDSAIAGGQIPDLTYSADIADRQAHVTAVGTFASFDPAVLSGREEARGRVSGTIDLDATLEDVERPDVENIAAAVHLMLEPSDVGGLIIDRGTLDGDVRDGLATVRSLDVSGRELNLQARGLLAFGETGDSNLQVHADSPRLQEIGTLIGRPLAGIAAVDATITGNRKQLQASGTLEGDGVKYEDNGALSLKSAFTALVPDFDFSRARVDADNRATFVTIAEQNINEITAKVVYENRQLTFNALGKQPSRSASASGALTLHPDHQEVHLERLGLETANQRWTLADGTAATIRYGGESVEVGSLRLVNGDQEVTASGRFGATGDQLDVALTNVDLAAVDALLLRPPQFTGRLNATAAVTGSKAQPIVEGQFSVAPGSFRDFTYQSFSGTAEYKGQGFDVDSRLQQNDTQWITAKGYVPIALFKRSPRTEEGGIAHVEPAGPADSVDLAIDSSPLGLGLIQGFTTAVQDVQGTLEAHVRLTGSAEDPHPTGRITIADGGALVVPTGVTYSNIRGQIDLEPDRVRIEHIVALDNHDSSLSMTGDLGVHERGLTGGQLWITGHDFKVIDNDLGNLRVESAIELTGQLSAPEIRGDLGITTGRLNLDEILALSGSSVYATEAAGDAAPGSAQEQGDSGGSRPVFEDLKMNVRLSVPDALIVRASNLQPPGAAVGLGALNLTLGGDLTVIKEKGAQARLVGAVNTVRGNYDFQGRRFEILRDGTIRFQNEEQLDPVLDIRTRRVIQGVEARVNVRGRMSAPEIQLTSTPPLDEADILALIVFNQPLNQLGTGEQLDLAARAQGLATGVVAGQLAQAIGTALNVDTFEINVAPDTGTAPEVTLGQQLGGNFYFKVQQGLGDDASTNVIVEYELNRFLRFQSNVLQGGSTTQSLFRRRQGSGADLIILFEK